VHGAARLALQEARDAGECALGLCKQQQSAHRAAAYDAFSREREREKRGGEGNSLQCRLHTQRHQSCRPSAARSRGPCRGSARGSCSRSQTAVA
jgi:hypothetical protein